MEDDDQEERQTDEDKFLSDNVELRSSSVHSNPKNRWMALGYLLCYFVTVAAILGTGASQLPVVLSQSGFLPFVVVFLLEALIQILVVLYVVELLQRGYLVKQQELLEKSFPRDEDVLLNDVGDDSEEEEKNNRSEMEMEVMNENEPCNLAGPAFPPPGSPDTKQSYPSLYILADLFLDSGLKHIFQVLILFMFVSNLINSTIAVGEACTQLLDLNTRWTLVVFVCSCAFLIIFVNSCVIPFVSLLTFLDACLLVIVTACSKIFMERSLNHNHIQSEFKHIGQPFVWSTLATGLVVNILPLLFAKVKPSNSQICGFCRSVIAGILTCVVVIILWAAAIKGHLSPFPVLKISKSDDLRHRWIAVLVQIFFVISISVSFLTFGAGMKHMVDSWFDSFYSTTQSDWQELKSRLEGIYCRAHVRWFLKKSILLTLFGFQFAVATLNPKGTVTVLRNFASIALNIELGVFVVLMLRRSHAHKFSHLRVPVPLSRYLYHLQFLVFLYCLVAIGFNIVEIIQSSPFNLTALNGEGPLSNQTIRTLNSSAWNNSRLQSMHNRRWRINNHLLTNGTL